MEATDKNTFILTAPKHSGKTTAAKNLIETIRKKGLTPAGIIAPSIYKDNKLIGFNILDIKNGKQTLLLDISDENKRDLVFTEQGMKVGQNALDIANLKDANIIILDEFGPLEMKHQGWREQFDLIIQKFNRPIVIIVRAELANEVGKIYNVSDENILGLDISISDIL